MYNNWKDGTIVDIHKEMTRVTLAIISKSVLGYQFKQQDDEVGDALLICMEYFNRLIIPFGKDHKNQNRIL
jgi:cytochrome P450